MAAVRQNGHALQYVNVQTEELCMEAVRQSGRALQYVHRQTEALCIAAVRQAPSELEFVEDKYRKACASLVEDMPKEEMHTHVDDIDASLADAKEECLRDPKRSPYLPPTWRPNPKDNPELFPPHD